jgi:hypothetical protein
MLKSSLKLFFSFFLDLSKIFSEKMKSNELLLDDIFSQLANMPVRCNGIQYIVSCSMGHEFKSKIKLISGKNLCFLRSQRLKWL